MTAEIKACPTDKMYEPAHKINACPIDFAWKFHLIEPVATA